MKFNKARWGFVMTLTLVVMMSSVPASYASGIYEESGNGLTPSELKASTGAERRLAIIIDDFGNDMKGTEEILSLPVKLTVAVMPFLRTSEKDARMAHEKGHDVIIHLPMEPKQGKPEWLGPGAILSNMSDAEVREKVEAAIKNVPYAVGINNHMGSKITGNKRIMSVILDVCKEHGLFFVDSKTNYHSIVGEICDEKGLPRLQNDIFLDDVHSVSHVTGQLRKVQERLQQQSLCVTIGHVGVGGLKTAEALKRTIPEMKQRGIHFVGMLDLAQAKENPGNPGLGVTLP